MIQASPLERVLPFTGGTHTLADVAAAVARGDCQEWAGERSVILTEIRQTPRQRILLFWLAAGDLTELRAMAGPICAWGKQQHCVKAQLIGRRGWERSAIVRDGWQPVSVVMEKEL